MHNLLADICVKATFGYYVKAGINNQVNDIKENPSGLTPTLGYCII